MGRKEGRKFWKLAVFVLGVALTIGCVVGTKKKGEKFTAWSEGGRKGRD